MGPSVTSYKDYRLFLKDSFGQLASKNSRFSMRAYARHVGMSPSHLSRLFSGKKALSVSAAHRIALALGLSVEDTEYFLALVGISGARATAERTRLLKSMARQTSLRRKMLSIEMVRAIADWQHFAILTLTQTEGFSSSPLWISKRLGLPLAETKAAIRRLLEVGLLEENQGKLRAKMETDIATPDDLTSEAIRENHRQQLGNALKALSEQPLEQREFRNTTVSVNPEDLPEAKKMIRAFVDRFSVNIEKKSAKEVFQLNVQFFQLSKTLGVRK